MTDSLITIEQAIALYPGVLTRSTCRALIRSGRVAAVRVGRHYAIRAADLAALLAPTVRTPAPRERRSPSERIADQLAGAGIAPLGVASVGSVKT